VTARDPLKVFADRLRELREACSISQQRLSELAGLNRNYVLDVERGRRNPCLGNIVRIAERSTLPRPSWSAASRSERER
jgi:transcriptional regulator with XRE-family HTH domain